MKIDDLKTVNLLDSILKSPDSRRQESNVRERAEELKDRIELSRKKMYDEVKEMVLKQPDIRREKIEEIKPLVETKTYNIKGELVAKAILKSHLLDAML